MPVITGAAVIVLPIVLRVLVRCWVTRDVQHVMITDREGQTVNHQMLDKRWWIPGDGKRKLQGLTKNCT